MSLLHTHYEATLLYLCNLSSHLFNSSCCYWHSRLPKDIMIIEYDDFSLLLFCESLLIPLVVYHGSGHGICSTKVNICEWEAGYFGVVCHVFCERNVNCSGHGRCDVDFKGLSMQTSVSCICDSGYRKTRGQINLCPVTTCELSLIKDWSLPKQSSGFWLRVCLCSSSPCAYGLSWRGEHRHEHRVPNYFLHALKSWEYITWVMM